MMTKLYQIDKNKIDKEKMREAGQLLLAGELVAFPTETVYGLGGNALDASASRKIYAAKGRPSDNPLIVHIADWDSLDRITSNIPEGAKKLADVYWPGPLTMIFPKSDAVPVETTGGLDSVAVRMPNHPIALELIRQGGGYVAAPSANTSGRPSPTEAKHVAEDLNGRIAMILDGGNVGIGLESTIVDFTEEVPTVLRPGAINLDMLTKVLGEVRMDPGLEQENEHVRPKAPGMRYRHYAPKAQLAIVEGDTDAVIEKINALTESKLAEGKKVGIISTDETYYRYKNGIIKSIGSRQEEESIARHLYGILRDFDEEEADCIYSESFETPKLGMAIMNRLLKAAGHKIIDASEKPE
ncbi:MAG: L-threonylcarbamoyladenylate synthase [Lachnospiraceae bacterium]|nr:L-threonylcarbamoyladenylate synthase [Lachnospiraceae bacterium]